MNNLNIRSKIETKAILPDGTEIRVPNLLEEFINSRTQDYLAPQRAGIPRGRKVGFSDEKYRASLLVALLNWSLKEIATKLGFSYGQLRNWNTEPDFQAKIKKHSAQFVSFVARYIRAELKKANEAVVNYTNGIVDEAPGGLKIDKAINCMRLLNKHVINDLDWLGSLELDKTARHSDQEGQMILNDKSIAYYYFYEEVNNLVKYAKGQKIDCKPSPLKLKIAATSIKQALSSNKEPSESERRYAIYALTIMEEYFVMAKREELEKEKELLEKALKKPKETK